MSKITNVMRRSLISSTTNSGERRRRSQLENIPNPLKRMGALALHELVVHHPDIVADWINKTPSILPSVVGAGKDAVVYKISDTTVAKVHRRSISMDRDQQTALQSRTQDRHTRMAEHMAEFTLAQHTEITGHPIVPSLPVVITYQPFKQVVDPKLFERKGGKVNHTTLFELQTTHPDAYDQLGSLVESGLSCYKYEDLVPDLCGKSNLAVDLSTGTLIMLDGQPHRYNGEGASRTLARLQNLATVIS